MPEMQIIEHGTKAGLPARREPDPLDERALRSELAAAIEASRAATARAQISADAEARARTALQETQATLEKLEHTQEQASAAAILKHAKIVSAAIRAGSPIPSGSPAMPADAASMAPVRAQVAALQACLGELVAECDGTKQAASAAAAAVGTKASAVTDCVAKGLIAELRAARDLLWRLEETASGFFIHDAQRPGGPKFEAVKNELARALNREADMMSQHPEFGAESWKLDRVFQQLNNDAEKRWNDFHRRLCESADAVFEGACAPAEQ